MDYSGMEGFQVQYQVNQQHDTLRLAELLQQANTSSNFIITTVFYQEYLFKQFQDQFQAQMYQPQDTFQVQRPNKLKYGKWIPDVPSNLPKSKSITMNVFSIDLQKAKIFNQIYSEQIQKMQNEYEYKISCHRQGFTISMGMQFDMSLMCLNKLLEMNDKLGLYYCKDKHVIQMLQYSPMLKDKIKKKQISSFVLLMYRQLKAVFFSTLHRRNIIKAEVQTLLNKDISILKYSSKEFMKAENECTFDLLRQALHNQIATLSKEFEVQIQINRQDKCIVFHNLHRAFEKQLLSQFQQSVNHLCIFAVKSSEIRLFDNFIKRNINKWKFLYGQINSYRSIAFLAIKKDKIKDQKQFIEFLKIFPLIVNNEHFELMIFIHHLVDGDKQTDKLINLVDQHKLNLFNLGNVTKFKCKKLIVRIKDFSQPIKIKRQKQIMDFLFQLIFVKQELDNGDIKCTRSSSKVCELTQKDIEQISRSFSYEKFNKSISFDEVDQFSWLKLEFKMPVTVQFEESEKTNKAYIKAKRSNHIEKLFNDNMIGFKFKVYDLVVAEHIVLPKEVDKFARLAKHAFVGGQLNAHFQVKNIQKFQIKEEGTIIFMSVNITELFVPTHFFQRIK